MLAKKNRINKKEVNQVFKKSLFLSAPNLTFRFKKNPDNHPPKISFIVSKTVAKQAVKRNALRRLGYKALEQYNQQLPAGIIGVFLFKRYMDDILILKNDIQDILNKVN